MKFGWCLDGNHRDCRVTVGEGRLRCDCPCHDDVPLPLDTTMKGT